MVGIRGLRSNGGKLPPRKSWGTPLPRGGTRSANVKGHSGGAGSRGRSQTLNCTEPAETKESWAGGTSGDEGEQGGTSGDEGELDSVSSWDGAGSGADPASSWGERGWSGPCGAPGTEAGSGADPASSWDGAGSGADPASSWDGAGLWSGLCELLGWSGHAAVCVQ